MRVELLDYALPPELIAERPLEQRDSARLLCLGKGGAIEHREVIDLADLIPPRSVVVVNDTRVIPARLFADKVTGGKVELLLLERELTRGPERELWRALARSSKPLRDGAELRVSEALTARVAGERDEQGSLLVELVARSGDVAAALEACGHVPLPPYIKRADEAADRDRYQTMFARASGAVAAPTAGLHFTPALVERLRARGVTIMPVTLHVSLGTFQPVKVDDLDRHEMHAERYEVPEDTARALADARSTGAAVVALGTTVVRALESAALERGQVAAGSGRTRLLIQPGFSFRVVDALITNFHLPRSTLLALVAAFAGLERVREAYALAVAERYRFFSYGDAMWIAERAP